jgi:PIN domain nuclease of toxin-antitoxin system
MRYLLDTHVALQWVTGDRKLDKTHAQIIERAERAGEELGLSAFSLWEIAKLVELQRLKFAVSIEQLFEQIEAAVMVLPLTASVAIESTRLGGRMHRDPADQIIVATARRHGLTLLTNDRKLIESGLVAVA